MSGGSGISDDMPDASRPLVTFGRLLLGLTFGVAAGAVSAAIYAAVVIFTGFDNLLLTAALGAAVGFAVAAARPAVRQVWISTMSVLVTLASLLLVEYLLLRLWDGDGYAPMALTLGEAAGYFGEYAAEEPLWLLLNWGAACLAATGAAQIGDQPDGATPTPWRDKAQVVHIHKHPQGPALLDIAMLIRTPDDRFIHRRMTCSAQDVTSALPHLFDQVPEALAHVGKPATPRRVNDQYFDTAEEALKAAHTVHPPAQPEDWTDGEEFCSAVEAHPDFADLHEPDAERLGVLGQIVGWGAGICLFGLVMYLGYLLNVRIGLDTPQRRDTLPDHIFAIVLIIVSAALSIWAGMQVASLIARRNNAGATSGDPVDHSIREPTKAYENAQPQDPRAASEAWQDSGGSNWPWRAGISWGWPGSGLTPAAWAVRGTAAVAVYAAVTYAAYRLPIWIGHDTPETRESALDSMFAILIVLLLFVAAGAAVWAGVHARAARTRDTHVAENPQDVPAVPATLKVTGRTRIPILLGWVCGAALFFYFGAIANTDDGGIGFTALFVAAGFAAAAFGVHAYQRAIIADDRGVTIHNLFRTVTIPWNELHSIGYQQVDSQAVTAMYYTLTFNNRFTAQVPGGGNQPGEYLHALRDTLLRMQQQH